MSKEQTQDLIGKLLPHEVERDAIHIAVLPAIAGKEIYKGDKVLYANGTAWPSEKHAVGIVDPFLEEWRVEIGKRFYIWLFPNTITGLRHAWDHPCLKENKNKSPSETWLENFANSYGMDYRDLLEQLNDIVSGGVDYLQINGQNAHGPVPIEVWDHYEKVTGKSVSEKTAVKTHFSCSC